MAAAPYGAAFLLEYHMSEGNDPVIIPEAETLAPPPAETTETETPETQETTEETAEGEQPEAEENEPKRESGYKRMKRRALIAEAQLANARLKEVGTTAAAKDDKAPKEEDYNGDWGKYIAATAAYEAAKAVRGSLAEDRQAAQKTRAEQLNSEVLAEFEERKETFKAKAKDFDEVVSGFVDKGGKFSDAIRELVIDSDLGPQLTYHLAKNPVIASKLNALPPLQAAKEIARLEDTLSKPSSKAPGAPPPIKAPKGGSNGNFDPNNASMDEYVAKRNAGWKG